MEIDGNLWKLMEIMEANGSEWMLVQLDGQNNVVYQYYYYLVGKFELSDRIFSILI